MLVKCLKNFVLYTQEATSVVKAAIPNYREDEHHALYYDDQAQ